MNMKLIQAEVDVWVQVTYWVSRAGHLPRVHPSVGCCRLLLIPSYTVTFVKW